MSNRFERLFQLPANQYIEGSPVILAAGLLLKDTETGSIITQLKFQSVAEKRIKAVKVSLAAYDVSKTLIQGVNDYQYLEMDIASGQEFGANKAIIMPNPVTRSFAVSSVVVVFSDGSTWESHAAFDVLPALTPLPFDNAEMEKQYRIATNENAKYAPCEDKGLWQCTCGKWNKEGICKNCRIYKYTVFTTYDIPALTEQMNSRLAAEAEQKRIAAEREAERKAARKAAQKALSQKAKIAATIIIPIVIIAILFTQWLWPDLIHPSMLYKEACNLMEAGSYQEAIRLFEKIEYYKDSTDRIEDCHQSMLEMYYTEANTLMEKGHYREAFSIFERTAAQNYKDSDNKLNEITLNLISSYQKSTLSAGFDHVVGLKNDGSVISTGSNRHGQCNTSLWNDIIAVSAGGYHTVGLKSDGTVLATGYNHHGQCDVSSWKNIVAIYAGSYHTIGLTSDGKVVIAGIYYYYSAGELLTSDTWPEVSSWRNVYAIGAGNNFTVIVRDDHTVIAVGDNKYGQCNTSDWNNIYAISISSGHTVALKSNGTVVATGIDFRNHGQCDVANWNNIIAIAAGTYHTVGLQVNGKVVAVGYNEYDQCNVASWENVVAVAAGSYFTVALLEDGSVVATGNNEYGQCNVSDWTSIRIPN